jgi:hypothetical protein
MRNWQLTILFALATFSTFFAKSNSDFTYVLLIGFRTAFFLMFLGYFSVSVYRLLQKNAN